MSFVIAPVSVDQIALEDILGNTIITLSSCLRVRAQLSTRMDFSIREYVVEWGFGSVVDPRRSYIDEVAGEEVKLCALQEFSDTCRRFLCNPQSDCAQHGPWNTMPSIKLTDIQIGVLLRSPPRCGYPVVLLAIQVVRGSWFRRYRKQWISLVRYNSLLRFLDEIDALWPNK